MINELVTTNAMMKLLIPARGDILVELPEAVVSRRIRDTRLPS